MEGDFQYLFLDREGIAGILAGANPPHRHEYQEIIWVRKGTAHHLLDDDRVEIRANTLLIVPKGRMHRFDPSEEVQCCVARFHDSFLPAESSILFSQFFGPSRVTAPEGEIPFIECLFSLIAKEYVNFNQHHRTTIRFIVQALAAKIEELTYAALEKRHPAVTGKWKLWEQLNAAVEEHYRDNHSTGFYARELGISLRKLNQIVKAFLGKTAAEAIEERRILEAKRLILYSDMNIKEIAFDLGYEEHSYFTRVFRRFTGLTPSAFKREAFRA